MTDKKPVKKAPAKKSPTIKEDYSATISLYGRRYQATGASVHDAISNIAIERAPHVRGILTVRHGEREKDRILNVVQVQRLFSPSPMVREVALKNTSLLFDA